MHSNYVILASIRRLRTYDNLYFVIAGKKRKKKKTASFFKKGKGQLTHGPELGADKLYTGNQRGRGWLAGWLSEGTTNPSIGIEMKMGMVSICRVQLLEHQSSVRIFR